MYPRFSLRLLLAVTTLFAMACYWAIVRPTAVARQYIEAVEARDIRRADSLCGDGRDEYFADVWPDSEEYDVEVQLIPRRWNDFCRLQQRMSVRIVPLEPRSGSNIIVGIHADIIATSLGVQPPSMYPVVYR